MPAARVRRDGEVAEISALDLVPGDIVMVEAGDLVPADGRILVSASLEVAESALTGESAPRPRTPRPLTEPDTALGDRSEHGLPGTRRSRAGPATVIVTETGSGTEMGKIAGMLNSVEVGVLAAAARRCAS